MPDAIVQPRDRQELAEVIRTAPGPLRFVGAGHSFAPLVATGGTIVSLDQFNGMTRHDPASQAATLGGATRLGEAARLLRDVGQALPNMGDIDRQSLAGALATGTHGSGATLPGYHAHLEAVELVDGRGEVRRLTREGDRDLLEATGVSLGVFGAATELTMRNVAAYRLRRRRWAVPLGDILAGFDGFMTAHRSAEFYVIPFSGHALLIASDPTDAEVTARPAEDDDEGLATLKRLRTWLRRVPSLRRRLIGTALAGFPPEDYVEDSFRAFVSTRRLRFNEMEYHLPYEEGAKALRAIVEMLERCFPQVYFPIEVRSVAADDFWLSPFYRRQTCSIAVHHDAGENPNRFMVAAEQIFRRHGGRPHWGKMHNLTGKELAALYPRWREAMAVRRAFDPDSRFVSPYVARLLGLE